MTAKTLPGGTFTMAENLTVTRMGYGAMQLAGPHVFGPPADREEAVAVLRGAVELGITHIDTSDYYGPPSRWRGCYRAHRTSCSSQAPHPSRTCARTSPGPG